MKKEITSLKHSFLLCGSAGLCLEILWTGFHSILHKDYRFLGQSSILMFPIYGMASLIGPISQKLKNHSRFLRGVIYTVGIFVAEYSTGTFLRRFSMCPWDYSKCPHNVKGLIRLDYAPVWFVTGLFFEKILSDKS